MTIVALWLRKTVDEVWCIADSRITGNNESVITDNGPKILPIPVACYKNISGTKYKKEFAYSYGFAFAGSTLTAISTHSLVSACTQNLACSNEHTKPVSLKSVAELYRKSAEEYIRDISGKQTGSASNISTYFFTSFIFGYCELEKRFMAYGTLPQLDKSGFKVVLASVPLERGMYYPLGSGIDDFNDVMEKGLRDNINHSVIDTMKTMLNKEIRKDVGGYFQAGVAYENNFQLLPILSEDKKTEFLGIDTEGLGEIDGYRIGYQALSI